MGTTSQSDASNPLERLGDDDREFVLRFLLASGSLKELAQGYGVSYPTIRARLDKLLQRLRALLAGRKPDPMADLLADYVARGEVAAGAARGILKLHRQLLEQRER
ncbi:MAG TPA: DUF2089 family protein [Gemmataceae bacterium]|jgi:hypothetical protein|nr:DUF2089 family protein [Gemmataceae bacterium]